jgi:hypothetical protein
VQAVDNPRVHTDDVDRLLEDIDAVGVPIDLEVEAIVGRVSAVRRRLHVAMRETLIQHAFTPEDWHVLTTLRLQRAPFATAGALARDLEISAVAMTSRLTRLEPRSSWNRSGHSEVRPRRLLACCPLLKSME